MNAVILRLATIAVASVAITGCASKPVLHPPSATLRDRIGNVAVVALSDSSRIRYQVPDSKADIAAEERDVQLVTPLMIIAKAGSGVGDPVTGAIIGGMALATPIIVMGGGPLWNELHRAYGIAMSDSAAEVAAARSAMDAATARVDFKTQLRERFVSGLQRAVPHANIVPLRRDADTVLELMVFEPVICGREGINPALGLSLGLRVRLLDARSGRELYYDYLDYSGSRHTLVSWAAQDARVFHDELQKCLNHLSGEVVTQLFTRASSKVADRATLAALGIERRPAVGLASGGGELWPAPRTRGTIARK